MIKIVFCIPGKLFSNHFLKSWSDLLVSCESFDVSPIFSMAYNPNIYKVRNLCLMGDAKLGQNQKPFSGKLDYDYIMWIDSDSVFTPHDFKTLLDKMEKDKSLNILSGLYLSIDRAYTAGRVLKNNLQGNLEATPLTLEDVAGQSLIKVDYAGMGFMLVRQGVFESLKYPWFYPMVVGDSSRVLGFLTEDIGFCIQAESKGYATYIDPTVNIGHEKSIILR